MTKKKTNKKKRRVDNKKRSVSQRIGTLGEAAFAYIATIAGLLPTRMADDVGLDFICQIDGEPGPDGVSEIASEVLGACVRTTTDGKPKLKLTRDDAGALLRAHFPTCVVLLQELPDRSHDSWFRLLDQQFRDQLLTFLASNRASVSIAASDLVPTSQLKGHVAALRSGGYTETQKVAVANKRLERSLNAAHLEIRRDGDGAITVVTALDMYAYFDELSGSELDRLYRATFGAENLTSARLSTLAVKSDVMKSLSGLPMPFILQGFTSEFEESVQVDGEKGKCNHVFTRKSNGEFWGWCEPHGFALTLSRSKPQGTVWVHELRAFADPETSLRLDDYEDLWEFLCACEPDSKLGPSAASELPFYVSQFRDLSLFGWYARYLRKVVTLDGWQGTATSLSDAVDEESMGTLAWLAYLASNPSAVSRLGFSLEAVGDIDKPAEFEVPVVTNTSSSTIVSWLECSGFIQAGEHEDEVRGLKIDKVLHVRLEVFDRVVKQTTDPEFWLDSKLVIARGDGAYAQLFGVPPAWIDGVGLRNVQVE